MVNRRTDGGIFWEPRIYIPIEWELIIKAAAKAAKAQSVNAYVVTLLSHAPEVREAWEKAGKPDLPPMVKPWGSRTLRPPAVRAPRQKRPTQTLWGRALKTNEDDDDDSDT